MGTLFEKLTAVFVSFWLFSHAAGHPEWPWKMIAYVQYQALKEAKKPWGCPSIFNKGVCTNYDPTKYR